MITSKGTGTAQRRAASQRGGAATAEADRRGRSRRSGVPQRALADGVVERRRAPRTGRSGPHLPSEPSVQERGDRMPEALSPAEHYRVEMARRGGRVTGDLPSLIAEAKAEYEAQLAMPRPAGKGGRPRKKKKADDFDLSEEDELGREG